MTDYKEILRLASLGISKSKIAESMEVTRQTVITALQRAVIQGVTWETAQSLSDRELALKLKTPAAGEITGHKTPDYEYVHKELVKPGVTQQLLWEEYCVKCRMGGDVPYSLTQFKARYREFASVRMATMRIARKPGEIMEVDWAGQTAEIIDSDTGELIPAYLFVAALPYSGYAFCEAFTDMKAPSWIAGHVDAYAFFCGVTKMLVPDNLKTGVLKHTSAELILNRTYQEMAEHYGTAIIPTRVRAPKDKATVEGVVGIVSICILAAVRNEKFFSLRELNAAIRERLSAFNVKPFQKKDGSRFTLFSEERQFLLPLPSEGYEISEWRTATVQYNYHVSLELMNYSVPFAYIKKRVDIRLTRSVVEVFFEGSRICSHQRLYGRTGQYSTVDAHMPPDHQAYVKWNGERFKSWAKSVGEHTEAVICAMLTTYRVEQQAYRGCMALLKLADEYPKSRLEAACERALFYTPRPGYKQILSILKSGQDSASAEKSKPQEKRSEFSFVRGSDYYGGGKK
ncbi:MAG: IS21 family transposase [Firmicutes bacterium]|nr:IS21 family transposase [Bacillota bacterium]